MKKLSVKILSSVLVLAMLFTLTVYGKNKENWQKEARDYKMLLSSSNSIDYVYSETERDIKLERALVKELALEKDEDNVRYYYNKVDLNEDGKPEIFAYLVGSPVCGTGGCSAVIFKQENEQYTVLSKFTLVNNPVIISNSKTKGYRDIIMHVSGGGIESFSALIRYDGTTYPSNPSIQPKVMPGTKVNGIAIIADDITKSPGIELRVL